MALVDSDRCYVKINEAAIKLFQYAPEEVIGARAARTARDTDSMTGDVQWAQLLRNNELYGERVVEHSSGTPIRVSFAAHTTTLDGQWMALIVVLSAQLEASGVELIRTVEPNPATDRGHTFTEREREIVRRVALGHSTPRIADELYLSRHTVRTHIRNAMIKADAHTSAQLVAIAFSHGLIDQ